VRAPLNSKAQPQSLFLEAVQDVFSDILALSPLISRSSSNSFNMFCLSARLSRLFERAKRLIVLLSRDDRQIRALESRVRSGARGDFSSATRPVRDGSPFYSLLGTFRSGPPRRSVCSGRSCVSFASVPFSSRFMFAWRDNSVSGELQLKSNVRKLI
jgi:hypothetical protein